MFEKIKMIKILFTKRKKFSDHSVSASNGNVSFDLVYSYPILIYA